VHRPRIRSGALLLTALSAVAAAGCGGDDPVRPPNLLLVTLDTVRADYLGCYGAELGATPALDALAAEGARFATALSASAVTPVSHATILTGQFPYTHGMRVLHADGGFRLRDDRWYLPDALKRAGYATAAVHSAFPVSGYFGFERSFDVFESFDGALESGKRPGGTAWNMEELQRRGDETTDLAIEVLAGLEEPFFLWLHYWDPHDSLRLPPDEFVEERGGGLMRAKEDLTYAIELEYLDGELGRLMDHVRERGLLEDTLVALTADHGEGLEDGHARHGWKGHRMLYQEQIHVPLLLRLPDRLGNRPGSVVEELVRTADIVPTLLDYADVAAGASFDGKSLRPLLEGTETEPRIAYADQINGYDRNAHMVESRPEAAFLYTVTDGEWKLTYRPHMPERSELFNLSKDPEEVRNVYEKRPRERRRLLADLARRRPWVTTPFPPDGEGGDLDVEGALGALGYASGVVADVAWEWTCVEHDAHRLDAFTRCPDCDEPLLPIQAGL
jgi:arylsulfatase A-like enzyme